MNLGAYASASVRQSLKIRCYPYGKTSGNEDFSPYMDFTAWVYPSPSVAVENELEKVCSYTDNFQPARFAADPLGAGIYAYNGGNASRYFTGGRLNAVNLAADGITSAPMKYTFTLAESGCSITQTYNQPVTLAPDLSDFVMPKTSFCFDETINLRGQTSVVGGEFSGFGVSGSEETFSTSLAGIGNGDIYFRKTESGCNAEKRITVNVRDLQESSVVFNQPPAMCANDAHVYLPDYLSDAWASGGTFSGSGVESPRFYPDRANGGYPRISYAYGLTGCRVTLTKEVRVKTPQTLTIANIPAVCNTNEIDLMNYVNIKDGVFTAAGGYINGSAFDPVQSGIGSHPVTYSVTDANGCILSRTFNVIVNDLLPDDAVFDAIPEQCGSDAGYIDLRFYVRGHTGGEWKISVFIPRRRRRASIW